MLTADVLRAVALLSVAAGALTGWVSIVYTAVAAFLVGTLSVLFNVADTAALRFLVPAPQGSSAVVQLQARENAAWLVGGPLGGFLFGLGRALPFLFDGVSYLIGVVTTLLIRRQFQGDRAEQSRGVFREMWHGLRFVWRQPDPRARATIARRLELIPEDVLGRAQSFHRLVGASTVPLGALLGGVLYEAFGVAACVAAFTGVMLLVAVAASVNRGLRG